MTKRPKEILQQYWGHSSFRGSQQEVIDAVLEGKDVLALMPTGGGKSLCYQIPSLVSDGICIVVSPLVALIQNQVAELKSKGIKAIALTGGIKPHEINDLLDNCMYGNYKFLYLSPERLQQPVIQERIRQMQVNLFAIDEAHCISQWGHDFRPAYLNCAILREIHPEIPMLALTATATPQVSKEIEDNLGLRSLLLVKDSFERKNIGLSVVQTEDKNYGLHQLFKTEAVSGIVYVKSRRKTLELASFLNARGISAAAYHGGMSKKDKEERLNDWLAERTLVMVATNAFGMGIDKPNVRLVVHFEIPDSIEHYFQEAGRAGRDGAPSKAILLTNDHDTKHTKRRFLASLPSIGFLKKTYRHLTSYLQIAYGEGSGEMYSLNFNKFCHRYGLDALLTYNTLQIFDRQGLLQLNETFHKRTTVHFTITKETLFGYLEKNKAIAPTVLVLLRTYGGVFDFETKIDTYLLAKKVGCPELNIHQTLQKLSDDSLIAYETSTNDISLTFLVPREDEKSIYVFAKTITNFHQLKVKKLESVLDYLANTKECRSRSLLHYFGETTNHRCGICDVCTRKSKNTATSTGLKAIILQQLKTGAKTSRILTELIKQPPQVIVAELQGLLEEEIIAINHKNEYVIIGKR
ncbi:ATP-dependent DNA helicase RecQ [Croceitalea dokdonensis DOKDO 023]|uniref:ATP-dependent DNA helicase RecQ n=1 Tax=Croceitalea dokdonensis DOKDO 023 TaxID=1300341 RepID=A0A0P7AZQ3_9FLAO|nr:ATP-dependent DNA helicase RecQ [Croceitalea dokdonensis]KPM33790.1 ATP-dependent DNA helicase RecQ [Croceitalea dokdonensis DOKDO 023]